MYLTVDMVLLSEKPNNAAPERPKTLDFQARRREEEEKARQKAVQFARLSVRNRSYDLANFVADLACIVAPYHCRLLPRSRRCIPLIEMWSLHLRLML